MSDLVLDIAIAWLVLLLGACALRVLKAPSTGSRILALDTLILVLIGLLVLHSLSEGVSYFLDAALILAVLGFMATIAAARFHARGSLF
jgi:multisubunit Na+/H+ antiporter MnhF subunit